MSKKKNQPQTLSCLMTPRSLRQTPSSLRNEEILVTSQISYLKDEGQEEVVSN